MRVITIGWLLISFLTPSFRFPLPAGGTETWFPSRSGGNLRRGAIMNYACAMGIGLVRGVRQDLAEYTLAASPINPREPGISQPLVLIAQQRVPVTNTEKEAFDPNLDILPALTHYLKELRKMEIIRYSPQHPSVLRFAHEKRLERAALESPDTALLLRIGHTLNATYVLIARCTRQKESQQLDYEVEVWQSSQRAPLWQRKGTQQIQAHDPQHQENALHSLARTIVLQLNAELWHQLPTLPGKPLQRERDSPVTQPIHTPAKDPQASLDPDKLIREGRLSEALLLLRAEVNRNPLNDSLRLKLIDLYGRLGLKEAALEECVRAIQLMSHSEPLLLNWARLMREQGRIAEAIQTLRQWLQQAQASRETLLHLLFDMQLLAGDFAGAASTLNASRAQAEKSPEQHWRAFLLQGIQRQFTQSDEPVALNRERFALLLFVVSGLMNDLANELLDLRRLASDPAPDWKALRERGEQIGVNTLDFGRWLGRLQPDEATREACGHLQFGAQLMGQAAQQMARYLLFRKTDDLESATLLRAEALRELEAAAQASRTP
jgi:tetratricopeptide (TPR) repeat protein